MTHAFWVPAVVQSVLDCPGASGADLSSLQLIGYGAAPMTEALLRRALARLRLRLPRRLRHDRDRRHVLVLPPEDHDPGGPRAHLLRSVGRPLPWVEIGARPTRRPADAVADGEVGEIWVRSRADHGRLLAAAGGDRRDAAGGGWLRTGDAAHRDADGYVFLHDRLKDMIISGGENVYPAEVENVLAAHPAVADVAVIARAARALGRDGQGGRRAAPGRGGRPGRADRLRPRPAGPLQVPDLGRPRRRAAAQRLRQGAQEGPAGAVLGRGAARERPPRSRWCGAGPWTGSTAGTPRPATSSSRRTTRCSSAAHLLGPREAYVPATLAQLSRCPGLVMTVHQLAAGAGDRVALVFTESGASARLGGRAAAWSGVALFRSDGEPADALLGGGGLLRPAPAADDGLCDPVDRPAAAPWDTAAAVGRPAGRGGGAALAGAGRPGGDGGRAATTSTGQPAGRAAGRAGCEVHELFSAGRPVAFARVADRAATAAAWPAGRPRRPAGDACTCNGIVRVGTAPFAAAAWSATAGRCARAEGAARWLSARPHSVLVEREGAVLVVTINRPAGAQRHRPRRLRSHRAAMDELDADPALTLGILTGAGGHFCSGMDLKAFLRGERRARRPRARRHRRDAAAQAADRRGRGLRPGRRLRDRAGLRPDRRRRRRAVRHPGSQARPDRRLRRADPPAAAHPAPGGAGVRADRRDDAGRRGAPMGLVNRLTPPGGALDGRARWPPRSPPTDRSPCA